MSGNIGGLRHGRGPRSIWRVAAAALAIIAGAATHGATVGAQEQDGGLVRVVHGLRGLVADIYLDGTLVLPTFQPERSTDPLPIPAGVHKIDIRQAGASADDKPLLSQRVDVPAGFRGSLVAHLDGKGNPKLTAYADDFTAVPAGQSRVVVRHTADAEPVAVLLDEWPTFGQVGVSSEVTQLVGAGPYEVSVTALDGGRPLAPPEDVDYREGTATFMYLIGSQSEGTLGWAQVRINDLETAPTMIQTGDGTSPSTSTGMQPAAVVAVVAVVGGSMLAGGAWLRRRRADRLTAMAERRSARLQVAVVATLTLAAGATVTGVVALAAGDTNSPEPAAVAPAHGATNTSLLPPASTSATSTSATVPRSPPPPPTTTTTTSSSTTSAPSSAEPSRPPPGSMPPDPPASTMAPIVTHLADIAVLAPRRVVAPVRVTIAALGVDGPVLPAGVDALGELDVPPDARTLVWYRHGPLPGDAGSAVIAGHLNWKGVEGLFANLAATPIGALVTVSDGAGAQREFRVTTVELVPKPAVAMNGVFARGGARVLRLVTCGGEFDDGSGHYLSNVVVTAVPV